MQSIMAEITYLNSKRNEWANVFSKGPFCYSITLNLIWKFHDRRINTAVSKDQLALQGYKPSGRNYVATGPSYSYESEAELFKDLAICLEKEFPSNAYALLRKWD